MLFVDSVVPTADVASRRISKCFGTLLVSSTAVLTAVQYRLFFSLTFSIYFRCTYYILTLR